METSFLAKTRATAGVLLAASLCTTALLSASASRAAAASVASSQVVSTGSGTLDLGRVGSVNLAALSGVSASSTHAAATSQSSNPPYRETPLGLLHHPASTSQVHSASVRSASVTAGTLDSFGGNVAGESGFDGIDANINGSVNNQGLGSVGDVSPPDQGLAAGPSPFGTAIVEFVNDSLEITSPSGKALIPPIAAFQVVDQPPATFLSDPRAYWDPSTGHWFLTMFAAGQPGGTIGQFGCDNGGAVQTDCLSAQYVAVSATTNPLGTYEVFWFDTTDGTGASGTGGHIGDDCSCFGDYDMVGADHSGFYITTNEFCFNTGSPCSNSQSGGFNGTVMYAMSKSDLIAAAEGGTAPPVNRYALNFVDDPYAAYHLSPSTVTQGSSNPDTEYFVESNANLPNDATTSGLEVFALLGTSALDHGGTPTLVRTSVNTDQYTELPPQATQKSGPLPLGQELAAACYPPPQPDIPCTPALQTDFNAIQEVTYASGQLYAELDTGFALGQQENSGAAWFVLRPTPGASSLSAANEGNGYVETTQDLLYPVISVDPTGHGFMTFTVSGPAMFPSAAYVSFNGTHGPGNVVHIAAPGVNPLDDFTCYPPFGQTPGGPGCRWGDYSMAQAYNGNIYMATEYVPNELRDTWSNWGTRVFSAPAQPVVGYRQAASNGQVFSFNIPSYGSAPAGTSGIVGIATDPATGGYWLAGSNGAVYAFNAPSFGSMSGHFLRQPIVGIAAAPGGNGYWLVAKDGGIFSFGPGAHYYGSTGGITLRKPIVGMAADPATGGYWLVASDGGVFAFRAPYLGSTGGMTLRKPIVGMAVDPATGGYWLVASDGGVFAFHAPYHGSTGGMTLRAPIVGMAADPATGGYWLVASDGGVFSFLAPFLGSTAGQHLVAPIVSVSST